ncbi:Proteasome subunit beta type-4 [Striga hermonthica]|uniref:Proteasome subunit beta n=1 Tax=Striga hermonthica TaxID=68872 RepID=A0A9N7RU47_STRHE|nr:Proteasome subunit beta type-4 [Striga hermonthica]
MNLADSAPVTSNLLGSEADSQRTLYPYVTGTSVVGIKYKDGILLAADMGGSYGSTLRYKTVERLKPVGKHSIIGASGEISDFQEIMRYLDELILFDNMWDDGNSLGPKEVHNYLTRVMYNRRNKFNPLWNSLVLGGIKNGQKYLGTLSVPRYLDHPRAAPRNTRRPASKERHPRSHRCSSIFPGESTF